MQPTKFEISETLGKLNQLAPAGYALGFHVEYTTPKFVFQTYPKAWLDYYSSNGLIMMDPMVAWGFENAGGKRWSGLEDPAGVLKMAGEYGMKYGVVIAAVSGDSRSIGGFAHPDREFTDDEIAQLEADVVLIHDNTADTASLDPDTVEHLKKMSIMVTHPGS
ncbi:autoinducer binding domain-containing protein [Yoonia sp. F2084L]|uniref:autoinducer binding domain-containing protein n=1 Tax=Yoonia sp. F2084L TaxID=2926419 RepID=UPI001FF65335|nr:autoinducer binding domain-containing protein [Yoonia sp. F2084L]MCK0094179.1 autoinducer binding domain-containing protein [Yoonia sp. F2084L]